MSDIERELAEAKAKIARLDEAWEKLHAWSGGLVKELYAVRAQCAAARQIASGMLYEVEAATAHRNRGRGGQEVPFHGDFASAMPSALDRIHWWGRAILEALDEVQKK